MTRVVPGINIGPVESEESAGPLFLGVDAARLLRNLEYPRPIGLHAEIARQAGR
jgi:hypothetical protein